MSNKWLISGGLWRWRWPDPWGDPWGGNQTGQQYGQNVHNGPYVWPAEYKCVYVCVYLRYQQLPVMNCFCISVFIHSFRCKKHWAYDDPCFSFVLSCFSCCFLGTLFEKQNTHKSKNLVVSQDMGKPSIKLQRRYKEGTWHIPGALIFKTFLSQ